MRECRLGGDQEMAVQIWLFGVGLPGMAGRISRLIKDKAG